MLLESALNPPKHYRFDGPHHKRHEKNHEKRTFSCVKGVSFDMCFIVRSGESPKDGTAVHHHPLTPVTRLVNQSHFTSRSLHT